MWYERKGIIRIGKLYPELGALKKRLQIVVNRKREVEIYARVERALAEIEGRIYG